MSNCLDLLYVKSLAKAKLKAANQQKRVKLWKQHFENLLENPLKVTNEPITRIISKQLDIKLGPFTKELDSVLRKIKNRKAAGLDEIPTFFLSFLEPFNCMQTT